MLNELIVDQLVGIVPTNLLLYNANVVKFVNPLQLLGNEPLNWLLLRSNICNEFQLIHSGSAPVNALPGRESTNNPVSHDQLAGIVP